MESVPCGQGLTKCFLVGVTCASFLVDGAGSCFSGSAMNTSVFWAVCGLGMALGSLSANEQVCFPVLLKIWSEISSTGASCPLSGAWPLC